MKILIACEFSGIVRDAFLKKGHDVWSCDLLPTEKEGPHLQGNILDIINSSWYEWDFMIAHPPCTYLTNAGVRHLHDHVSTRKGTKTKIFGSKRWIALFEAAEFFNKLKNANIEKIAIENPIPHKYAKVLIGRYNQLIQPWMFGHGETKATCLWLKNLPKLIPTDIVEGREHRIHKMSPTKDRWKKRSVTYQGIANAMAEQWG